MDYYRTIAASVALTLSVAALPLTIRADQLDDARTLMGLAAIGSFPQRTETVGALPDHLIGGIPLPSGLEALGGAIGTSADGNSHAEALFFTAPSASAPNYAQYANQLTSAGWTTSSMPAVFAMPTIYAHYCKTGSPMITVQTTGSYMIVRAYSQGCAASLVAASALTRTTPRSNRAPLPEFSPPDGASFTRSTISYGANSSLAAAPLHATQDLPTLLALFSKQMTDAGWAQYGTAGTEGAAFIYHVSASRSWVASLALVRFGSDQYSLTVTAFEVDPQNSI